MVREAVDALGGDTTNTALKNWILSKYPGTNPNTISAQTVVCTVNHPSRIHFPENRKPRVADGKYDFLFRPAPGRLKKYDRPEHGEWAIVDCDDGSVAVGPAQDEITPSPPNDSEGRTFAAEAHLRDYLANRLGDIEEGLELYAEDDKPGIEYRTEIGVIDILAKDKQGNFVVIELKLSHGEDSACGQLLRYMGWVRRHLAEGNLVRGIIIAFRIPTKTRYAAADLPNVELREYELALTLRLVPKLASILPKPTRPS
jgi:hypothetical protein